MARAGTRFSGKVEAPDHSGPDRGRGLSDAGSDLVRSWT